MQKWLDLENKVVIVTGGSSGIGKRMCQSFMEQGAQVVIVDLHTPEEMESCTFICCDVTSKDEVEQMVCQVMEIFGHIDVLVNNVGVSIPRLLVDADSKYELDDIVFDKTMDVNVKGAFHCAQACAKSMLRQHHGVILNISSECSKEGSLAQSVYSASKAAIESLTRSWAKELSPQGIRVVAIAPGPMEATALFSASYIDAMCHCRHIQPEAIGTTYHAATLMGREGHLEEIANTVLFLASDRASFITGTTINVSGGKSR